ncbi:MAG: MG2 domain-containing protein [Bacteroidota bacterium]|nr:MG2 domain-containing protein [Bacteroidota bacterium]
MNTKKIFLVGLLAIASILGAITVTAYQTADKKALLIFPKGSTYEKEWKKVDSLTNKGLTKSALEVVQGIYDKAKTQNNAPQYVKAIIHRMKFEQQMEEYSLVKALNKLNEEAAEASYPVKPVLHSMIAESYWQYYQNNRWKFYNRSATVNFDNSDITTWDLKTIFDKVIKNYQASLLNSDSLKRTPLNIYDDVLVQQPNSRKFRPTLYDFLAHRAVDFYMNEEPDITRPAYKFELNSDSYFWRSSDFVKIKIESKDTLSLKYYAINTLQDLTAFHLKDNNPEALIDVDLKRLQFVRTKSVSEIKDSLYLMALQNLEKEVEANAASADVSYEIAKVYLEKAAKYNPIQSDEHKWMKKQALELCEATAKKYPSSDGAKNCLVLKAQITEHSLHFVTDKVTNPGKAFRALITYKNLKTVHVRIAQMDIDKYNKTIERYYGEQLISSYLKLSPVKEWTVELKDDGDFQTHSTEIKIPELPAGHYVIMIGSDKAFSYKANGVAYAATWISNISYTNRRMSNGSYDFYTLHRDSGVPLKGVSAQLYYEKYNYTSRKYEYVRSEKYTSNEDGFFNVPASEEYRNFTVDFQYKTDGVVDRLQTDNGIYQYRSQKENKRMYPRTFIFLDRGIYRPGQTVYFKGIMINTDGEKNEIMPATSTTVTFYDVNYQKVADATLTTNEYGTFNGTFTAPVGVLNGQMSISNGSGTAYFSVEEYKRPKFEVSFIPVKGSYRLNETIKAEGLAKAYSGARIDGAEVKFRVVRNASFPYWWYWWRGYYPQSAQMEIVNGVTTSNDTGAFFIDFKALPDPGVPKSYEPTYGYTVYADVTDINGETHSSQSYISVAYTALNLNVSIPAMLEKENIEVFRIYSTNMSGQFEPAKGKVEIFKLIEPVKTYRSRLWARPDIYSMTKEEFEKSFPNDEYKEENNMYKWARGAKVFEKSFSNNSVSRVRKDGPPVISQTNDSVKITDLGTWKSGVYVMEAHSKDAYGEDVKDIKYFTVYSNIGTEVPSNDISWFNQVTTNYIEPGEKAKFVIGSKEENVKVLYEIEYKGQIVKKEYITLNKEQKLIEIPVEEKHRGNFSYHLMFVKNNRTYSENGIVSVPYTNKELDLEFESFRNKLLPGQQEEWKIKIKDKKGDKMAAEMMATLYDASLDAFKPNYWYFNIYSNYYSNLYWDLNSGFGVVNAQIYSNEWNKYPGGAYQHYDLLNWFGYASYSNYGYYADDMDSNYESTGKSRGRNKSAAAPSMVAGAMEEKLAEVDEIEVGKNYKDKEGGGKESRTKGDSFASDVTTLSTSESTKQASTGSTAGNGADLSKVAARSNFAETAFFYPQMETDKDGNVIIKFTIPEALTKWKMMGFAHTKDLKFGMIQNELVTQKDLMVIPNAPRFFREGDNMEFSAKISNLSDAELKGDAQLFLYDATTMKDITTDLFKGAATNEKSAQRPFTSKKGQSSVVSWYITIPEGVGAITYKVVAKAGNFTDGEEMALPVLTNRMLVTESMPLPVRGNQTKTFRFEKLINQSNASTTLRNHKLTLEFTSNPAWYAVQALPYLMEYPYECSEQTFSRFYANSIASHIANSSPKIKAVFNSWKSQSPEALLSNLEKNQELKSLMLEETPWVLDAKDESERKKRIALLFDLNKMSAELTRAMKKLQKAQTPNGGWPWFEGMRDDRYITQHIVTGMGHLDHLGVKNVRDDKDVWKMVVDGVKYLDNRIREDYEWILKYDKVNLDKNHLGYTQIQYLYARSYFKDVAIDNRNQKAFDYYKGQAKKYWLENSRYMQGMIALSLHRNEDKTTPKDIMKSLKENSLSSDEMGMYWKDNYAGYYWYQAPIEAQALLIEAFDEVTNDKKAVDDMKVWLLKSKQTQDWKTTKATTEAVYALLLRGTDWLSTESNVEISLGDMKIDPKKMPDLKVEAGTGYFKTSWSGSDIKPKMGEVTVTKKDEGVSWGALYWQYFEQLDKITSSKTPLVLKKQLFLQKNTDAGPVIEPISDKTMLKVGDKIKVRIELRVDRDMEYVQMKDMRASGFEPTNVISMYKWQDGLGYYESTRDAATNFFFDRLPKGTYVFEYPMVATHNGNFSNGITSIQCMYAPEFTSNSEGIRVKIGK